MTIKPGERIPSVTLTTMQDGVPTPLRTDDVFAGKKVLLFALPGAFTPTCSNKHLPGYVALADGFAAKGIDQLVCLAVNDVFVMDAWGANQNIEGRVLLLSDGNGELTTAMGLEFDARRYGMGIRSQRYAMLIEDGVLTQLHVEEAGGFNVSSAEYMLETL